MTIDSNTHLSLLRSVLEKAPLKLAVLFGSRSTGRANEGSDFDIGILPLHSSMSLHAELELASALSGAVGHEVDVVRLDDIAPLLGREMARDGICLFEYRRGEFAAFRARAMSAWIDFDETMAPFRKRFLEKLAKSGSGRTGGRT